MKSPLFWYRRYKATVTDLLRQYDRTATPAQWRRARIAFVLMALFGRNKERHLSWLESIKHQPGTDNGFAALLYFPHINSVFYRILSIPLCVIPICLCHYAWFLHHDHVSVVVYANGVVAATSWIMAICIATTKFIHRMNDTTMVNLLFLFLYL